MQHRAAIAQAGQAFAVQQVRIDARHLRRRVGAHAERAAAQLVDQLEGLQVELTARPRQQRFQVLQERRHHQLEAVAARHIEQPTAQLFDVSRLRGQDIGDVLGQQPSRRHGRPPGVKAALYRRGFGRPWRRTDLSSRTAPA
jgi:hypothetical protein